MTEKVNISGVDIFLTQPVEVDLEWVGDESVINQLKAAWLVIEKGDLPLTPRILGKPGIGKTTLAYATGKRLNQDVYIFQCTMDTRPEDLLVSPVIASDKSIKYVGSSLISAMIKGGICLLDEGNRMSEKSWASLAPLMDKRRYIESIITGLRIYAHPDFRLCVTMNSDSSTYEIPEYILSRMIKIQLDFPDKTDEFQILKYNIPYSTDELLNYCVEFLQNAHMHEEPYVVRDAIKILRLYIKTRELYKEDKNRLDKNKFKEIIKNILDPYATKYCPDEFVKLLKNPKNNPENII
ncbi:MAG: MoxR family ATPase [Candidatus Lokiarchaeota archaeon]|nr:MoxR family ATPase [Candidatus Lokiarchaeota archaeon]